MNYKEVIKKQTSIIAMSVIGMCIILISTSYALFMKVNTSSKNQIVETGTLKTEYAAGTTLTTAVLPQSDTEGLSTSGYSFSVTNTGSLAMKYEITIYNDPDVDLTKAIPQEYLKVSLDGSAPVAMSSLTKTSDTSSETNENNIKYLLASNKILNATGQTGDVVTHNIKIWIDADSPESIIGDTVAIEVAVNGEVYEYNTYADASGASQPELYQGLIPVTYDASGNTIVADTTKEWYDYNKHNWANAVLVNCGDSTIKSKYFDSNMSLLDSAIGTTIPQSDIQEMYAWIPRYKYQLWNAENGSSDPQAINIVFENKNTTKSTGTTNGTWLTHPAFTFGTTELNGIWVGKFETSGTTTNLTIKPNQQSLTNITVGAMFNATRNTELTYASNYGINTSSIDTHVAKNMDWGSVAYLSSSIYGRYTDSSTCVASGCETWINNVNTYASGSYGPSITGCAGASVSAAVANSMSACANGYSWSGLGVNASTNGNITGIYDMSGGSWEYVMGNMVDGSGNYYPSSSGLTKPDVKYFDSYAYSASSYADHSRGKLGDATKETLKTFGSGTGGWYGDLAYFPNATYSWFLRGGDYAYGPIAGVFEFDLSTGKANTSYSFRSVLTAEDLS